ITRNTAAQKSVSLDLEWRHAWVGCLRNRTTASACDEKRGSSELRNFEALKMFLTMKSSFY
ncbi:MAG: hypothetical protein WB818_08120, partial [Desulfobacterales bacterium]